MGNGKGKFHYSVLYTPVVKQERLRDVLKEALPEGRGTVFYPCMECWRRDSSQCEIKALFPGYVFIYSDMDRVELHKFVIRHRSELNAYTRELGLNGIYFSDEDTLGNVGKDDRKDDGYRLTELTEEEAEFMDFLLGWTDGNKKAADEWLRWGGVENFKKVIFIRDVMKEWYVNGINSKVCNIDRLIDYLKPETKGYDLVTVGNSAGGYIATIIGIQLNASHIINFSGQNSIVKESCKQEEYPELSRWKMNLERYKYYDICGMIADSEIPVYYFYAAKCEEDINQFKRISQYENVKPFAFHTKEHGENMYPFNFPVILKMESDKFCKLQQKYNTKEICLFIFMNKTLDVRTVFRKFVPYIIYKYNYKVHRRLKNKKRTLFYKGIRNE